MTDHVASVEGANTWRLAVLACGFYKVSPLFSHRGRRGKMAGGTRRITVCKLGGKKRKAPQQSEEKKNESLSLSRYPLSLFFLLHIFQSKTQNKSIWTRTFLKVS